MAILFGCDHNSTLSVGFGSLLGCREITVSHSFPAPREIVVNFKLLRETTQF